MKGWLWFWLPAVFLTGCSGWTSAERKLGPAVPAEAPLHNVTIHQSDRVGRLDTPGNATGIACTTCHGPTGEGSELARNAPQDFHKGIVLKHGSLNCNDCHDKTRTGLHRADGSGLEFGQAVQLCAQCHGAQYRDYGHGAHGGMSGYWDLRRGPRTRNGCLDCHSPHQPAYPQAWPVHPPRDRFLDWQKGPAHE